jgi:integrase
MSTPLRAFQPEQTDSDSTTFRCDRATVRQVIDWWEQNPSREFTSEVAEVERRRLWNLMCAEMGDFLVLDCKPFQLDNFIKRQGKRKKKNNTLRRWNTTLQRPFNEAEQLGLIIKNPFRGLSYPEGDQGRDWTDDELAEVLKNASPEFAELVIGLRLSSLRPGEGCALCWPHISFDRGNIKIAEHKTRYATKRADYVPLNEPMIQLLQEIRSRKNPGPHVFLSPKRRPWTRMHADATFRHLRERLGLSAELKLHGCRHTFATNAILNDVGVMHLQQILRHKDLRTTQHYVHLVGKTDHLVGASNKAVEGVRAAKKTVEYTPLFDVLD